MIDPNINIGAHGSRDGEVSDRSRRQHRARRSRSCFGRCNDLLSLQNMVGITNLKAEAESYLKTLLQDYSWPTDQIERDSPKQFNCEDWSHTQAHLSIFDPDDLIWIGNKGDLRKEFLRQSQLWWPAHSWASCTCASSFKPGMSMRVAGNVKARRFYVVESETLNENQLGAVFKWLNQFLLLRAVVGTGDGHLHGWFDYPKDEELDALKMILLGFQCNTRGRDACHPYPLAGRPRQGKNTCHYLYYCNP